MEGRCFDMKNKLITGLRVAASAIENRTFHYEWREQSSCNCGSLFCALTGKSAVELSHMIPKSIRNTNATWETLAGQHCPITGMPTQKLFRELFGYGLILQDVVNLEYLRDPKVIARMNLSETVREEIQTKRKWYQREMPKPTAIIKNVRVKLDHENKEHVIAYMRAWADLLVEEGALDAAPVVQGESVA